MRKVISLQFLLIIYISGFAQTPQINGNNDSTSTSYKKSKDNVNERFIKRGVVPSLALISAGILTIEGRGFLSSEDVFDYRNRTFPDFNTNSDDFIMLAPLAALYGISVFSDEGRHGLTRQTLILASAGLLTSALVWPTKEWTDIDRPNGKDHAFPSGHTAYAFTIATFMDKEFRHKMPWVSYASYTIATATGILRILNNAHWMSDVLAGAGVGILSVNTIYWLESKLFKNKDQHASVIPLISTDGNVGFAISLTF